MRDDQLIAVLLSLEHICVKPAVGVEHFSQESFERLSLISHL